jgi:hypothetical protein
VGESQVLRVVLLWLVTFGAFLAILAGFRAVGAVDDDFGELLVRCAELATGSTAVRVVAFGTGFPFGKKARREDPAR